MTDLFGTPIEKNHDWRDEWQDMPEYNNVKPIPPQVIASFKFRNQEDFDLFMDVVKENLFNGKRVFDGKQKKNDYSAWYPLDSRPSEHIYIVKNPKCKWCNNDAERWDYREIDGVTSKIKTCFKCFELDTTHLIKRDNEK